jgi:3-phenylpropionate/cinnamic acid dioxygenase small subunit
MMEDAAVIRLIRHEARLLDEKRWDEWYELFTEDGFYWVPLVHGQTDPLNHTSLAYEDKLLLKLRIERLKDGSGPFSQHPPSRSQHVLQMPEMEGMQDGAQVVRTAFFYAEARGDDQQVYAGTVIHHVVEVAGALRIRLKRVNLLNCEAALPSLQLFL